MNNVHITRHAEQRLRQRGYCVSNLDLILSCSSELDGTSYLLTNRDAQEAIELRKKEIQILERSKGTKIVIEEGNMVTIYKQPRGKKRKIK